MNLLVALGVLASGALHEATCVFWVHCPEKNSLWTSVLSMLAATAEVTGIGASVHDWRYAPFFIIGYGAGTAGAVIVKRRWPRSKT